MGGRGSGRPPSVVKKQIFEPKNPLVNGMFLPNHSGDHSSGRVTRTPTTDYEIANKKYVDDNIGGAVEGTAVLSTGEGGGTKFLREDGDGTSSWQTPAGSGDVTAATNLTANTIVQGDDGAKGIKTSTATVTQIASNVTHATGDGSDHTDVASNTTHRGLTDNPHAVTLNQIQDPTGATAISMGSNDLKFSFSNPASDGFNIEAIGAFSGDLLHVHQHTGNPGAVNLVGIHAIDVDVTPLYIANAGGEIFKIDNSGNLTLSGTVDGIDIATDVTSNTTHATGDGSDHANVSTNTTGIATNVTAIGLNTTHRSSAGGTDHSDVNTNNAKVSNVTTDLSAGTRTATTIDVNSSDGTNATLVEADTTNAGILGSNKWDEIVANSTHTAGDGSDHANVVSNNSHRADVTGDPHNIEADTLTFTNKTFDANGTGNSLSNVDVSDLANGTDGELITWNAAGTPDTVAVGTATHVLTSNGAGAAPTFQAAGGGGGFTSVRTVFTSSGTFTKHADSIAMFVEIWGAGGGGARDANGAGGGGGGNYNSLWIDDADVGANETVTIGAAGTGKTSTDGDGGIGGDTTFGTLLTGYGGGGGGDNGGTVGGCGGGGGGALSAGLIGGDATEGRGGEGGDPNLTIQGNSKDGDTNTGFGGGGGGGDDTSTNNGGLSALGGGGGGGSAPDATNLGGTGGATIKGGGGGGGSSGTSGGSGGNSLQGGNGGAGGASAANGTAGTQPGGGGGGSSGGGNGASGGAGKVIVWEF